MVLNDPQTFGGLEEYATTLAIGLQQQGHQVSFLSTTWVPSSNQYYDRLGTNKIPFIQPPRWLSRPASHGPTKLKVAAAAMRLLSPATLILTLGLYLRRRGAWPQSAASAYGWLHGQLLDRLIGPDRRQPLTRLLLRMWRWRWRPDLLHIQGYTTSLLFVIDWAHANRLPVVYEEHQTPDAQFNWWADFESTINKADIVVAVSDKSAEALRTVCGVTRPIAVRHNMVADPMATGWASEADKQPCDEALVVTTVARLFVTKGLSYLLEAIAQVRASHPAMQFRVYGDGELRAELLACAAQLGLDGNEIFVGAFQHRDLPNIMAATSIFVLPSILEGQPLAVVEALAYGRPIIATAVGGIPEVIEDGVNGLLCQPKDPACLAQKIRALIEDPQLRGQLGRAARRSYEQGPFQAAAVCATFGSLYANVLLQRQGSAGRI
jgi:glycosyltransferase involved in cell wall biosynthesis